MDNQFEKYNSALDESMIDHLVDLQKANAGLDAARAHIETLQAEKNRVLAVLHSQYELARNPLIPAAAGQAIVAFIQSVLDAYKEQ